MKIDLGHTVLEIAPLVNLAAGLASAKRKARALRGLNRGGDLERHAIELVIELEAAEARCAKLEACHFAMLERTRALQDELARLRKLLTSG